MKLRVAMLALFAGLAVAAPASADTLIVTGFGDDASAPGCEPQAGGETFTCPMLRSAVNHANDVSGEDTIFLPGGAYTLDGELELGGATIVLGAHPRTTTVLGTPNAPVFSVNAGAAVTFTQLTLGGGSIGLSVAPAASAELLFARVTGASGAGVFNRGTVELINSLVDGHGAQGVSNVGVDGALGQLEVQNSTIAANVGGGISAFGGMSSVRLEHATVAGNTGAGLSFSSAGGAQAYGSIIADNGGGANCSGGVVTGSFNVEDTTSCALPANENLSATDPGLAGALSNQGGYTDVLTIPADSPAVDYVNPCGIGIDQRPYYRFLDVLVPCDAGAYEQSGTDPGLVQPPPDPPIEQPPPPPPPPPPVQPTPTPTPAPEPVVNQTAVGAEKRGTVKVQLPGSKTFVDLDAARGIPMGSTIDTRKGAIEITTVPKAGAPPQKATFSDGLFRLTQRRGITNLTLVEKLDCSKKGKRAAAAQKGKKPKKRKLWGDGKGAFRTTGRYSAATVRGTRWLVEDTCTTTTTRVTQGSVTVQHGKKRVVVRAGKRYVARGR